MFSSMSPRYPRPRAARMWQQPSQAAKRLTKFLLLIDRAYLTLPLCQHPRVATSHSPNSEDWATREVAYRTKIGWSYRLSKCILTQTKRAKTCFPSSSWASSSGITISCLQIISSQTTNRTLCFVRTTPIFQKYLTSSQAPPRKQSRPFPPRSTSMPSSRTRQASTRWRIRPMTEWGSRPEGFAMAMTMQGSLRSSSWWTSPIRCWQSIPSHKWVREPIGLVGRAPWSRPSSLNLALEQEVQPIWRPIGTAMSVDSVIRVLNLIAG